MAFEAFEKVRALLDWRLLPGSHKWPGPDGGTCINEAAIVAAGFPYTNVGSWRDCPPCFSPVLSAYLIMLNDTLGVEDRQLLMRYVLRLSGSADTVDQEIDRAWALVEGMTNAVVRYSPFNERQACERLQWLMRDFSGRAKIAKRTRDGRAEQECLDGICEVVGRFLGDTIHHMQRALHGAVWRDTWDCFVAEVLMVTDKAFGLGNQAPAHDVIKVERRLGRAKKTPPVLGMRHQPTRPMIGAPTRTSASGSQARAA